jgi:hypothetical protein
MWVKGVWGRLKTSKRVIALVLKRKRQRPRGLWRSPGVLIAHQITHRPIQPADACPGLPPFVHLPAQPVMPFRVAPYAHPLAASATASPGYPESRSFGCYRRWIIEATRFLASFSAAGCEVPGCPGSPPYLPRLRRRLQVSLLPASSGFTGDGPSRRLEVHILRRCRLIVSGLPRTAVLRYRRRSVSEFPRNLHLPAPADELPGCPGCFTRRLRQRESSGHPESSLTSGSPD